MVKLTIDGQTVEVAEGTSILEAAHAAGAEIPTLCYFAELNAIGSCRVCVVEVEGEDRLAAACNTAARDGMIVHTDTEAVQAARTTALKLLLSQHSLDCAHCVRAKTCRFQKLLMNMNLIRYDAAVQNMVPADEVYAQRLVEGKRAEWPAGAIIQRTTNKCVKCGRCVAACDRLENIGVWRFLGSGARANVGVADGMTTRDAGCVACGQCITHCPTAALTEHDDIQPLLDAIADPAITTVVQIAPATATAWAVGLGAPDGSLPMERLAAALKQLGVDYVFNTGLGADLTVMEEATELLGFLESRQADENGITWPLFTSACPAWVQRAKSEHFDVAAHLSAVKTPMMTLGALVKTWFAEQNGLDPANIFSVALTPCTAEKVEVMLPISTHDDIPDVNVALTTRELVRMVKQAGINVSALEDVPLDDPLGTSSGAGVILGTTGGEMEAALRTAFFVATGEAAPPDEFDFAVSEHGAWSEGIFDLNGTPLRCAVVHGLANANALVEVIRAGAVAYDFVEVMACPGGCTGGGGQPIDGTDRELGLERGKTLREIDRTQKPLRSSHENPQVQMLYEQFLGSPGAELPKRLLHII